eukprot:7133106-Ditylum_brightwellii.AAC.1
MSPRHCLTSCISFVCCGMDGNVLQFDCDFSSGSGIASLKVRRARRSSGRKDNGSIGTIWLGAVLPGVLLG